MKKFSEQENGTGQNEESHEKLSSQSSKAMKSEKKNSKAHGDEQPQKSPIPTSKKSQTKKSDQEPQHGSAITPKKPKSLMPVPKLPSQKTRLDAALKRLKVKPESLVTAPTISPTIKSSVKGGFKTALEAMRLGNDDPEIRSFLKVYDKMTQFDRDSVPWEAIALAAKVNPKHLLGSIQLAVTSHCATQSRFIAISHHPEVVRDRVKFAKLAGGERDRTQLDIMVGALPSAKGPTFIGKAVFGGGGGGAPSKKDEDDDEIPTAAMAYQGGDIEDRIFGTPQSNSDLDNKLVKIRDKRLEGLGNV
jgi:hypothetical protein